MVYGERALKILRNAVGIFLTLGISAAHAQALEAARSSAEILWDRYGVPHIYAPDDTSAMRALGYAQMTNHAEQVLLNIASARGEYAAFFGPGAGDRNVESDIDVITNDIPARARRWLKSGGSEQRALLKAFTQGANDWAQRNRATLDPAIARVLPVRESDALALYQLAIHYSFMGARGYANAAAWKKGKAVAGLSSGQFGSNAYAVSPARSATGEPMLVGNPHIDLGASGPQSSNGFPLARKGLFQWMEAHIVVGDAKNPGPNFTGVSFVGVPVLAIGFNDHLGWSHTVNAAQNVDVYDIALRDEQYRFGDRRLKLKERPAGVTVCAFGGSSCVQKDFTVAYSVHGPVIARRADGHALAMRVAGLDTDRPVLQYWRMAAASNLKSFEKAFSMLQMPYFNLVYADRSGRLLYVDGGVRPVRSSGDYDSHRGVLDGSDPRQLWTRTVPYARLPRVLDPAGGFIQNSNDSPWTSTFPAALRKADYPAWLTFDLMDLRPQQSAMALIAKPKLSAADMLASKQSTHMVLADRWLPDLFEIARQAENTELKEAVEVLSRWDRKADAESRGAVLFDRFREAYVNSSAPTPNSTPTTPPSLFAVPYDPSRPLETPVGIGDRSGALNALVHAVRALRAEGRALDVPWGEMHRVVLTQRDETYRNPRIVGEAPSSGSMDAYGGLRLVKYTPRDEQGVARANAGEGWTQFVTFGSNGARGEVLLVYGNATRPGSPHVADQLPFFTEKRLRPSWRTRDEVEANTIRRERL
ncbi:penicillin acylase family protein [Sphingosinicella microcystinivorans]|uniref:7-beta-(4-carbaxybutanamido)cephalosporanic acid acylase n=1 Tax=Sphingosinicella microcystinivorans TaxID=335406 RepID=A0AAD1D6H9_SPHMI|nr:penicillin acylase family protein [Sphingosinicella microcystinivorans]BBE34519.1 7-beta-(4-carbaxybutanamido)cephalosporanic acid acylase [Sphingosinicella microcystinivorans]